MPNLIVVTGLRSGTIVPLRERIVLGRNADVDLRLPDLLVSGRHAEVVPNEDGGFQVNDLASTNGTYLNGARLLAGGPLKLEDVLTVGSTDLLYTEKEEFDPQISRDLHDALVTAEDPDYEVRLLADVEDGLRLDETQTFWQQGLSQALPVVNSVQRQFSLAKDLPELLERVALQITMAVGGRGVVVALREEEGLRIALRAQVEDARVFPKEELDFAVREDLIERALAKRNILLARGGPDNTGTAVIGPDAAPPPMPALCVSLPSAAEVVGAVYVHGARDNLDKNDLRLLFLIAAQAGVNIRSHQLLEQVRTQNAELAQVVSARTAELSRADHDALLLGGILETIPEAVVSTTLEGVVTSWNRGAEQLYGFKAEEVTGELLPTIPDHRGVELDRVLEAAASRQSLTLRTERVTRDDRQVPIEATYSPVLDPEKQEVVGLVEIARGLSDQLRDEDRLRWQTRLASFGELAAGLAHELGGPLTNLRSGVEFLLARERSAEQTETSLKVLLDEIQRLQRLVQQALDLARWEAPGPKPCDCDELLDYVSSQLEARATEQGVELVRTPSAEPVSVLADSDQIKQALLNLASNALEAMPDGGRLELAVIDEEQQGGFLVSDTGAGIPRELQEKVFHLFFSQRSGGSGIGLAIVKRIVDLHAGQVDLESELGQGTTVRLRLPRNSEGAP